MLYSPLTCEWWEKQDDRRNAKVVSGNVIKMFATVPWNIWRGHFIPQQQKFTEGGMYIRRLLKFQDSFSPCQCLIHTTSLPSFDQILAKPLSLLQCRRHLYMPPKCKLLIAQRTIILSSLSSKLGQPLYYLLAVYLLLWRFFLIVILYSIARNPFIVFSSDWDQFQMAGLIKSEP